MSYLSNLVSVNTLLDGNYKFKQMPESDGIGKVSSKKKRWRQQYIDKIEDLRSVKWSPEDSPAYLPKQPQFEMTPIGKSKLKSAVSVCAQKLFCRYLR